MLSNHPRLRDALRSWKRRLRAPALHRLRRSTWYRSVAHLPCDDIVSCRDYVRSQVRGGDALVDLDDEARVELPHDPEEPGDGPRIFGTLRAFVQPATFVATLAECRLYGRGIAVVGADDRLIAEGSVHIGGTPAEHAIRGRAWLPRPVELPGTTVVLSAPAGNTYYHWLFDVLPRIALLRRAAVDFARVDRFAVSSIARPFQRETLVALGIDLGNVVETDTLRHALCERMILPSYPGTSGFPPRAACEFLRESLHASVGAGPERIYVSRQRARTRRIENAEEVERFLATAGFEAVHPEDRTVAEQARLFRGARIVVGPHGSGLSNLVFTDRGTRVLEIFPPEMVVQSHYRMLAAQVSARHVALVGGAGRGDRARGDYTVPLARLSGVLRTLCG